VIKVREATAGNHLMQQLLGLLSQQKELLDLPLNETTLYLYELRADRIVSILARIEDNSSVANSSTICRQSQLSFSLRSLLYGQRWHEFLPDIKHAIASARIRFPGSLWGAKKQNLPELHNQGNSR
jgi:hypothetical protein